MKNLLSRFVLVAFLMATAVFTGQTKYKTTEMPLITKDLNGTTTSSDKSLVENLKDIPEFSQFLKAYTTVKISELDKHEMFTVFVVPNSGFSRLDKDTMEEMFATKNIDKLKKTVAFHIVPGRVDLHSLELVTGMDKPVSLRTIDGSILQLQNDGGVVLVSSDGVKSRISQADFLHSKGYFHIVTELILPK